MTSSSLEDLASRASLGNERAKAELEAELGEEVCFPGAKDLLPPEGKILLGGRACVYRFRHQVLEVHSVLTPEVCERLLERARRTETWAPSTQISSEGESFVSETRSSRSIHFDLPFFPEDYFAVEKLVSQLAGVYRGRFKHANWCGRSKFSVLRYGVGERYGVHVDNDGSRPVQRRALSVLLYLNEGYEGGETRFVAPGPELTVGPRVGKGLVFPAGFTHPHESLIVTDGGEQEKVVLVGWLEH